METTPKNQTHEAQTQLVNILKQGTPFLIGLAVFGALFESWIFGAIPKAALGFLVGTIYAVGNVVMLFWLLAPFFFHREKPLWVLTAALVSLAVGAALMFTATYLGVLWALGLALGVGSPAILGVATLKSEKTPREPA